MFIKNNNAEMKTAFQKHRSGKKYDEMKNEAE